MLTHNVTLRAWEKAMPPTESGGGGGGQEEDPDEREA